MSGDLERGRASFERRAWVDAFATLSRVDEDAPLTAEDLERLATAACLIGRLEASAAAWERAHRVCLEAGELRRAARSAFWLAFVLLNHGEPSRGGGWLSRAQSLLDRDHVDCVERGYVAYGVTLGQVLGGDFSRAESGFSAATAIGERFHDTELVALAQVGRGRCLIRSGDVAGGMALLDEAMATIALDVVSQTAVGDLYCTVIDGCQEVFDVRRAQEWTAALDRWCEAQPDLVLYRGQCLVHRAELMMLAGSWSQALAETQRACERLSRPHNQPSLGAAYYVRAELHRLRGQLAEAEVAYRQAADHGRDPQPGLALLWLGQGRAADAAAALSRGLDEAAPDPVPRARLLGPLVEAALAGGDVATAHDAAAELAEIAAAWSSPYVDHVSSHASGAVLLAEGEPAPALALLRRARSGWIDLDAPHEAARTRVLIAQACRQLGDVEGAALELDAARSELARLGAPVDAGRADRAERGGLSAREVEVLQQLATGKSNRAIAAALFITEKTVSSHVSSILRKLDVESRAGATAYAHRNRLV